MVDGDSSDPIRVPMGERHETKARLGVPKTNRLVSGAREQKVSIGYEREPGYLVLVSLQRFHHTERL